MSPTRQRLLAFVLFIVFMTLFGKVWGWIVYDLMPEWALDLFFYGIFPVMIVTGIPYFILAKRKLRKQGRSRPLKDDYGFDIED